MQTLSAWLILWRTITYMSFVSIFTFTRPLNKFHPPDSGIYLDYLAKWHSAKDRQRFPVHDVLSLRQFHEVCQRTHAESSEPPQHSEYCCSSEQTTSSKRDVRLSLSIVRMSAGCESEMLYTSSASPFKCGGRIKTRKPCLWCTRILFFIQKGTVLSVRSSISCCFLDQLWAAHQNSAQQKAFQPQPFSLLTAIQLIVASCIDWHNHS